MLRDEAELARAEIPETITEVGSGIGFEQAPVRFSEHVTRVEVHLSDESAGKIGQHDQRFMLQARLEGRQTEVLTEHAATLEQAVHGAAQKLAHLLNSTLGRSHDHCDKTSGLPLSDGTCAAMMTFCRSTTGGTCTP
jgi:hypothetical protein